MQIIEKYFPNLNENQKSQFATLDELYKDWNSKINVISRKDIDNLYTHHILHSLGIAKIIQFTPESAIMGVQVLEEDFPQYLWLFYFLNANFIY